MTLSFFSFPLVSPRGSVAVNASRNATAQFTCSAMGGPMNVFTWTRVSDGMVLSNTSILEVVVESALDGSEYDCFVGNAAGNETVQVVLNGEPFV